MSERTAASIIEELNQLDEHQTMEAKAGLGKSTLETICAFANEPGLGGGVILIGVSRDDEQLFPVYDVVGVDDPDAVSSNLASQCASMFDIPIRPEILTQEVNGKHVLVVTVKEASHAEKPCYFKKRGLPSGAYRRIGSSDQQCTEDDMAVLYSERDAQTYDETVLHGATMQDIDPDAVDYYRMMRQRVNPTAEEITWSNEDMLESTIRH